MTSHFLNYMLERFSKEQTTTEMNDKPIITISRELGCHANVLAEELAKVLSKSGQDWKVINKEILHESAEELNISPNLIDSISGGQKKGFFVDIMNGFTEKFYTNDKNVRNTISRIIQSFAKEGYVIIVGRGAVAVTQNIKNALHIRLTAPIDFRAKNVNEIRKESIEESKKYTLSIDKKRHILLQYFSSNISSDQLFDFTFNAKTISADEIISTIYHLLKSRKLI